MRLKDVAPDDILQLEVLLSKLVINMENQKFFSNGLKNEIQEREDILEAIEKLVAKSQK